MTDEERERIAIEVQHLPPDTAQAEYDRRIAEMETDTGGNSGGME